MTWAAGDVAVCIICSSSTTAITVPAGGSVVAIGSTGGTSAGSGNSLSVLMCYKVLSSGDTSMGSFGGGGGTIWTAQVAIYRGVDTSSPIGVTSGATMHGDGNMTWAAVQTMANSTTNWGIACASYNDGTVAMTTAPSGMVHRAEHHVNDGCAIHDTDGGPGGTGWPAASVNYGVGAGGHGSFELQAASGQQIQYVAEQGSNGNGAGTYIPTLPAQGVAGRSFAVIVG